MSLADQAALTAAQAMGCNTIVKYLKKGEKFKFPGDTNWRTYLGRGSFHVGAGQIGKTGMRTGVIRRPPFKVYATNATLEQYMQDEPSLLIAWEEARKEFVSWDMFGGDITVNGHKYSVRAWGKDE